LTGLSRERHDAVDRASDVSVMSARILVVDDSSTIRKVVGAILSAHAYEAVLASDGVEALELLDSEKVDLVLLDFVMPRMNGYQFCRELRAHPQHRSLPVVLMSAKGDKIRGQFVQQTGAIDAITKPFDARGLIAVVEGALKKQEEGRQRPVPEASAMLDEAALERPSRTQSEAPGFQRPEAREEIAAALEQILGPELPRLEGDTLQAAFLRALTPDALGSLAALWRVLDFGVNTREVLAGDISVISIAEVLQLLDLQRQSGTLCIFGRKSEITLHIRQGNLDFAAWRGLSDEFLLGRYLVDTEMLHKDELAQILESPPESGSLLGENLIKRGLATEEQVHRALVLQASELLYEVVRWKSGRFSFIVGVENEIAKRAALNLETGSLVMEGFRRVDEWRLIEGTFDFDEVLYPDAVSIERMGSEQNLTPKERTVLEAFDGVRTIREIVEEMDASSFELCKIVFQLLNSRLVRRKAA
jgi:DNA-binding response OmpR family regulator